MIQAIETEYKGYRFRSRLEARWAVFFDEIGAKWEYEPEGFELADGTKYLPDFLLHGVRGRGANINGDIYVEVKGVLTKQDLHKVEMFADDCGCPDAEHPIIIFGQIPDAEWKEGYYSDGKHYAYWAFNYSKDNDENFYNLRFSEADDYWTEPKAGKGGGLVLDYPDNPYGYVDEKLTAEAYKKARQARFEHGEIPMQSKKSITIEEIKRNNPALYAAGRALKDADKNGKKGVEMLADLFINKCDEIGIRPGEVYCLF